MGLPFLHVMLLPKLRSVDLQDALFPVIVFYIASLLTKETYFTGGKCDSSSILTNPLVMPCSPPPQNSFLDRIAEWPFKDTFTGAIRWQQPGG